MKQWQFYRFKYPSTFQRSSTRPCQVKEFIVLALTRVFTLKVLLIDMYCYPNITPSANMKFLDNRKEDDLFVIRYLTRANSRIFSEINNLKMKFIHKTRTQAIRRQFMLKFLGTFHERERCTTQLAEH